MRPLLKWKVGEFNVFEDYKPHNKAKAILKDNFGKEPFFYCSYCDRKLPGITIDVEHVLPKGLPKYKHLETKWSNFLLGCKSCNGVKAAKDFNLLDVVLPHIENTFQCFDFKDDGTVSPNSLLSGNDLFRSQNTINLVGLNIGENHPLRRPQDDLFAERREVIAIAKRKLFQYKTGKLDDNDIISMALLCGFWSIWVYIFKDQSALLDKLIAEFKGTYPECRTKNIDRL